MQKKPSFWIAAICVLIVAIIGSIVWRERHAMLPGMQTGDAPWTPATATLRARLHDIGLPVLAVEGTALHIHQHLDIFIHGKAITVPDTIGENNDELFTSILHTEDASGTIHIESPTVGNYTLGQFFDTWGVRLTQNCIGGYCTNAADKLSFFVNGQPYTGSIRNLPAKEHQEIVITYGTQAELPSPIPASYDFPADE